MEEKISHKKIIICNGQKNIAVVLQQCSPVCCGLRCCRRIEEYDNVQ